MVDRWLGFHGRRTVRPVRSPRIPAIAADGRNCCGCRGDSPVAISCERPVGFWSRTAELDALLAVSYGERRGWSNLVDCGERPTSIGGSLFARCIGGNGMFRLLQYDHKFSVDLAHAESRKLGTTSCGRLIILARCAAVGRWNKS